jgi:localization factor PodJL
MTTAGPWSVKGIDPKARELAKDLARRSGMTLGEWLNQMIIEGEGEGEDEAYAPPPSPVRASPIREIRLSPDAELKRVGRALDVLTQRMETAENRSTLAISGIDQQVMGVLSRIEGVERDRAAAAARFDSDLQNVKAAQAKVSEALNRVSQEEGLRVEVMRSLEGALGRVAEKFHDVEGKTRAVMTEVREEVSNSSRRVDRLETRVEAEPATADGKLDRASVARPRPLTGSDAKSCGSPNRWATASARSRRAPPKPCSRWGEKWPVSPRPWSTGWDVQIRFRPSTWKISAARSPRSPNGSQTVSPAPSAAPPRPSTTSANRSVV